MPIVIDGDALTITLPPTVNGVLDVDVIDDLYEPWKDWVLAKPTRRRYPQAFRPDGGNPLSSIIDQGRYTFLNNVAGWRIVPHESDGTYYLTGNLAVEDNTLPAFRPTVGDFTAAILGLQPVTQGVTPVMAEQLEYASFVNGVWLDEAFGTPGTGYTPEGLPIGNAQTPSDNIPDAVAIDSARGLPKKLYVLGDATFDTGDDLSGWAVVGQNSTRTTLTLNSGATMNGVDISEAFVTGNLDGGSTLRQCVLENLNYINGDIHNCRLNPGTITLGGTATAHFNDTKSGVPGLQTPIIEWLPGQNTPLAIRGHDGGVTLRNKTGDAPVSIDLKAGQVIIELANCNNGTVVVRGDGDVFDENGNFLESGNYGGLVLYNRANSNLQVSEIHQRLGLNKNKPTKNYTDSSYTSDGIQVDATVDGSGNITHTRQ